MTMNALRGAFVDAWSEVLALAAARALETLSAMTEGERIAVNPVIVMRATGLGHVGELTLPSLSVRLNVEAEGFTFRLFCVFSEMSASNLAGRLLERQPSSSGLTGMEESAIGELANIQGSAFLDAASESLGVSLVPTPPMTMLGPASTTLAASIPASWLVATVRFESTRVGFEGRFICAVDRDNAVSLAQVLGLSARDAECLF